MGRKAIYKPEELEIGEKLELKGKMKRFSWQYLNNFNKKGDAKFKHVKEGKIIYFERIS